MLRSSLPGNDHYSNPHVQKLLKNISIIVLDEQKREKEFYEQHNSEEEKKIKKELKENRETGKSFLSQWKEEFRQYLKLRRYSI